MFFLLVSSSTGEGEKLFQRVVNEVRVNGVFSVVDGRVPHALQRLPVLLVDRAELADDEFVHFRLDVVDASVVAGSRRLHFNVVLTRVHFVVLTRIYFVVLTRIDLVVLTRIDLVILTGVDFVVLTGVNFVIVTRSVFVDFDCSGLLLFLLFLLDVVEVDDARNSRGRG